MIFLYFCFVLSFFCFHLKISTFYRSRSGVPVRYWFGLKKQESPLYFLAPYSLASQEKEVNTSCICAQKSSTVHTRLFKIFIDIFFSLIFYLPQKFELTLLWHIFSLPSSNLSLIRFYCQTQWIFGSKPLKTNSSSHIKNQINCVPQVANIKYKPTVG